MSKEIDINEEKWSKKVLSTLLLDQTTKRNIIWATDDYLSVAPEYNSLSPIQYEQITGKFSNIIQPRSVKNKAAQKSRTKEKAEVFTPSWIFNKQNNLVDHAWFEREEVFNKEIDKTWQANLEPIVFPKQAGKSWQDYVAENRLEITCGEAPYLVSRYDTVSGDYIELPQRIGLLDRKLRVVKENTNNEKDWLQWAEVAFKSIYGFEFQGDNLLLARENLLATYCDYMEDALQREPTEKELLTIAKIISWNLWQMDGLTQTIPFQEIKDPYSLVDLFD